MNVYQQLQLGAEYSKKDLASLLDENSLLNVREGVFSCKNSNAYFLFVDLEKAGKEQRFHFNDYFEEDYFHWDSQTTQHINSPRIQQVVNGEIETHLFAREVQKIKGKTQAFTYCGRLQYVEHDESTSKPVHIVFSSLDYDDNTNNESLINVYHWKPEKAGMTSSAKTSKKGVISPRRKASYKPPNITERQGIVTSRVGQGYYRSQLLEKFNNRCAVTKSGFHSILIASHIVPWSQSTDDERLDVNNGILLSPLYDALFDKHLISFDESGMILINEEVAKEAGKLNIDINACIEVDADLEVYLRRHRAKFKQNTKYLNTSS